MNVPFRLRSITCPRCRLEYLYDPVDLARCPTCCDGPIDGARDRLQAEVHSQRVSRPAADITSIVETGPFTGVPVAVLRDWARNSNECDPRPHTWSLQAVAVGTAAAVCSCEFVTPLRYTITSCKSTCGNVSGDPIGAHAEE